VALRTAEACGSLLGCAAGADVDMDNSAIGDIIDCLTRAIAESGGDVGYLR
jgi:hypothetical protein